MTETKTQQVQINLMGSDGEWFQPHQVPAALAALRALREDIAQYSGTYQARDLRKIREALHALDEQVGENLRALRRAGQS
jgi:hypothetical protein